MIVIFYLLLLINSIYAIEKTQTKSKYDKYSPSNRVYPQHIRTLHFLKDSMTTRKRSEPVPQFECIGGNSQYKISEIESIRCMNKGWRHYIDWKCEDKLHENLEISNVNMICEGYDNDDDEYILFNSCQLQFNLNNIEADNY